MTAKTPEEGFSELSRRILEDEEADRCDSYDAALEALTRGDGNAEYRIREAVKAMVGDE